MFNNFFFHNTNYNIIILNLLKCFKMFVILYFEAVIKKDKIVKIIIFLMKLITNIKTLY